MPVTEYVWNPLTDAYLMETDGAGNPTAVYTQEPKPYGGLISQRRNGQTRYYHQDALGSTVQLTDEDENVTDEYAYSAYGETLSPPGPTENPFRWIGGVGYYFDEATGDYYVRARNYTPFYARWTVPDPLRQSDPKALTAAWRNQGSVIAYSHELSLDLPAHITTRSYIYASNNPQSRDDPSGLWELRCRPLQGVAALTGNRHCWIECNGVSFSLLNDNGTANKHVNDDRDRGQGVIVAEGEGECGCIGDEFLFNQQSYAYNFTQCNSNYFASMILACCGIAVARPRGAFGWGNCNRPQDEVICHCPVSESPRWSGVV